jgi:hypothetical protein
MKDLEGSNHGPVKVLSQHLLGGTSENHKTLRTASVMDDTETKCRITTCPEKCLLSKSIIGYHRKFNIYMSSTRRECYVMKA